MSPAEGLVADERGVVRCSWAGEDALYRSYHDREWGLPVAGDRDLFELLTLEAFQSGLSWLTILRKRGSFRAAFSGFAIEKVARYGARDVDRLLGDPGIVRNRAKILATINNAQRYAELLDEFGGLAPFVWSYEPPDETRPRTLTWKTLKAMATTPASKAMSKDLKRRGWAFIGPTTAYSFMQSAGIVNDHITGCDRRGPCEAARRAFKRPARKREPHA
ncbi:MAG: DNA-3-methyladenine glycosylase I [Actinomycetota bacterium]